MTEESAVKVCVRVRPFIAREPCSTSSSVENEEPPQHFWKADHKSIHQVQDRVPTKSFSFDRVFTSDESTNQLYQTVAKPLVVSTVGGYNGTIFAYGQTSSGKTFTMMGSEHGGSGGVPGVIPLAVEEVFQSIKNFPNKEFLLRVSYMEIYNDTVADLLVDNWKRKPLEVREGMDKNVYVADLTEEVVTSPAQALAWIRKGEKNRHYGKTRMNQRSSRSHTIFRMILESRERSDPASEENADGAIIVSHLNLVDLAGSERTSQTGAEGVRLKEGCNINRSLFTLGQVIKKLTDENQKGFINYRDSKLTRILQNSLGGNAKTVIICTITPVALEETLSTLQFASTAKKMKNDPHVTEVSDDGALLKRYRNEIVDLKRRLHEVSSVTQTTATEKKILSQLLQEKEMLQREQEDRIKNLTKLLVTSSNQGPVVRVPKRRVTWGGKMLKLAGVSACDNHLSVLHFSHSDVYKKKTDPSCLSVMREDDEEFDGHWDIPDEPPDEMESSQASVTAQSFGDSHPDDWMRELSSKVWNLELQLDTESRQKEEAMRRVEELNGRVAELQGSKKPPEDGQTTQQRVAELELQLQAAAEEKEEAVKKVGTLELRVADLEKQSHSLGEADQQARKEFAEAIQLCEALASDKESLVAERDYLEQKLRESQELDEFKSLEEEFRKDQEREFQDDISNLKRTLQASEAQCQELQTKLERMSEQLKKTTEFAEELQNMSGKDLVQEVATLRRSLDDAEGLSRDTKKKWAHLRSENMALKEVHATLSANHEKMEAEVNGLRVQLESEKSRYKNMQRDLQKELNVAFEENTTLTSLLEGKVPKNLMDSLELEKTVARLNKDLTASRGAEETLRAQLESLPAQMDLLTKQVCDLTEELHAAHTQRDQLLSVEAQREEEARLLRDSLQTAQEELGRTQEELGKSQEELGKTQEELAKTQDEFAKTQEELARTQEELSKTQEELGRTQEELAKTQEELAKTREELAKTQEELAKTQEDLPRTQEEFAKTQEELARTQEELGRTQEELGGASLREDELRRQCGDVEQKLESLNSELQRCEASVEERSAQLEESERHRALLDGKVSELQQRSEDLQEKLSDSEVSRSTEEEISKELQQQVKELTEELQQLGAEREAASTCEETEELRCHATSLTAEPEQLQEHTGTAAAPQCLVESLQLELQEEKQKSSDLVRLCEQKELDAETRMLSLSQELQRVRGEKEAAGQNSAQGLDELHSTLDFVSTERDQLKLDLLENMDVMIDLQDQMRQMMETNHRQKKLIRQLETASAATPQEPSGDVCAPLQELQAQMKTLSEELQRVEAERAALLREKEARSQSSTQETEELQQRVRSLSEERDELQEVMEALRREKQQLAAQLDDTTMTMLEVQEKLRQQLFEARERGAALQQQVQQLEDQRATAEAKTESTRQLLHEANASISALTEQLDNARRHSARAWGDLPDRVQDSVEQFQVVFRKFQGMIASCTVASRPATMLEYLSDLGSLAECSESSLPKSTTDIYDELRHVGEPMVQSIMTFAAQELMPIQNFRDTVEQLSLKEVGAFEERRLQDVLLCRAQAPPHSVKLQDFHELWEQRLVELLDKRQAHLQKVDGPVKTLESAVQSFTDEIQDEIRARLNFKAQLYPQLKKELVNISWMDGLLKQELERRNAAAAHSKRSPRQSITAEHRALMKEVKELEIQAGYELMSEKSKNKTLLEAFGGAHLKTEVKLLLENHQQTQKLQQAEDQVKALCVENEELKEAQVRATSRASNHKQATQLLQTELQDSRALVEEKDKAIHTLRGKLRESESKVSPSAATLGNLQTKLTQMEATLRSATDEHHREIKKMSTMMSKKEESLRKLKETLRISQQEGEDSILKGKDLHARLTNPRGVSIQTSVQLENTKLEEEVKQLREKLSQLESLVSSKQAEINKLKSRTLKLKSRAATGRTPSPTTPPTKRGFASTDDPSSLLSSPKKFLATPRKVLDSPRKGPDCLRELMNSPKTLESPKRRFFDVVGSSEMPNWARPKQFFDNSWFENIPDGAEETGSREAWWPLSPKQQEKCKVQ